MHTIFILCIQPSDIVIHLTLSDGEFNVSFYFIKTTKAHTESEKKKTFLTIGASFF